MWRTGVENEEAMIVVECWTFAQISCPLMALLDHQSNCRCWPPCAFYAGHCALYRGVVHCAQASPNLLLEMLSWAVHHGTKQTNFQKDLKHMFRKRVIGRDGSNTNAYCICQPLAVWTCVFESIVGSPLWITWMDVFKLACTCKCVWHFLVKLVFASICFEWRK